MSQLQVKVNITVNSNYNNSDVQVCFGNGCILNRTVSLDEINGINSLAEWIISQKKPSLSISNELSKVLLIDYHNEVVEDEDGIQSTKRVLDNVVASPLPENDVSSQIDSKPVFLSGINGIDSWVNANVTDLQSAKSLLSELCECILLLKSII